MVFAFFSSFARFAGYFKHRGSGILRACVLKCSAMVALVLLLTVKSLVTFDFVVLAFRTIF